MEFSTWDPIFFFDRWRKTIFIGNNEVEATPLEHRQCTKEIEEIKRKYTNLWNPKGKEKKDHP